MLLKAKKFGAGQRSQDEPLFSAAICSPAQQAVLHQQSAGRGVT